MSINNAMVLAYCKKHGSITVRDAAVKLEINSPTKVISNMRHSDQYIVTDIVETRVNKDGKTKRYKRYFIQEVAT
jgi:predicted ArsR family transcriptional regulator